MRPLNIPIELINADLKWLSAISEAGPESLPFHLNLLHKYVVQCKLLIIELESLESNLSQEDTFNARND